MLAIFTLIYTRIKELIVGKKRRMKTKSMRKLNDV